MGAFRYFEGMNTISKKHAEVCLCDCTGIGGNSLITDATGYVDQLLQYLPFGELFISQRNSTFDKKTL